MSFQATYAIRGLVYLSLCASVFAQQPDRKHIPITMEEVLRQQTPAAPSKSSIDLNERLRAMTGAAHFSQDYLLGPGDVIEVTVYGIEDLKKKGVKKRIYKNREPSAFDVRDSVKSFYSRTRRHSHLGGRSPDQFEPAYKPRRRGVR